MKTFFKELVLSLVIALATFIGFQATVQQYIVQQTSMTPNIVPGERILINKAAYFFAEPERGDVIVFTKPDSGDTTPLIKRVIGLPGEKVEIKTGTVFINGSPIQEPYITTPSGYEFAESFIPPGHYFVLGDNRNSSFDSHYGWTVDPDYIIGKAWVSIWPMQEFGLAPNYAYSDQ